MLKYVQLSTVYDNKLVGSWKLRLRSFLSGELYSYRLRDIRKNSTVLRELLVNLERFECILKQLEPAHCIGINQIVNNVFVVPVEILSGQSFIIPFPQ